MKAERKRECITVVIAGHVDHGKSTVIGRLMADTLSLPQGKLEQVQNQCERNSKPFEYAFLLDALKNEQAQGITIDSARCFFKTKQRDYIIIDAPGHEEFIKNMVTGASRAEAAFIVVDAREGIRENSKRHAYLISLLGIKQVVILVNKMDLIEFRQTVFEEIKKEYLKFLEKFHIEPLNVIPLSAREGLNIVSRSERMKWYCGVTVLEQFDQLKIAERPVLFPLRFLVQDVYKFTRNDDRRILAGTVETGGMKVGDDVFFFPSGKESRVKSIESFNTPAKNSASAGEAIGVTLDTEIYLPPGETMVKKEDARPLIANRFKANMFWLGSVPFFPGKNYKMKIGSTKTQVQLIKVLNVLDASELSIDHSKQQVGRHEVAEVIMESRKHLAFDLVNQIPLTSRFVIVDEYEIAGGGVILDVPKNGDEKLEKDGKVSKTVIHAETQFGKIEKKSEVLRENSFRETRLRSVIKSITWRFFAFFSTSALAWLLTGKIALGLSIGFFDSLMKIGLFYFHERGWEKISFGRKVEACFQKTGEGI